MDYGELVRAWGLILTGYSPALSVELTKECPLSCPGCYAYQPDHVNGSPLLSFSDYKGDDLVEGVLHLIDLHRPLVVYIVGGEPLVRFRELDILLPRICERGVSPKLVTSAVRPIPRHWADLKKLTITVSVDGLQPEHDQRRRPATYARILENIQGHQIIVHCTVTSQMMNRSGYLGEFVQFWSERTEVFRIRMSFFTPQIGEQSPEILTPEMREQALKELGELAETYPKLQAGPQLLKTYLDPPRNPRECIFARVTHCVSADLQTRVEPCQLGGRPNCSECGCVASVGLHTVGRYRLPGGITIRSIFEASDRIGSAFRSMRRKRR